MAQVASLQLEVPPVRIQLKHTKLKHTKETIDMRPFLYLSLALPSKSSAEISVLGKYPLWLKSRK
uniref:Uncharacterized protein n=1 Tax=Picea glauca TaxID=3330 RepID=A0A117NJ32_PICGL|nr:hypothetical protein ABT39_MTgene669 [Picea glauca]